MLQSHGLFLGSSPICHVCPGSVWPTSLSDLSMDQRRRSSLHCLRPGHASLSKLQVKASKALTPRSANNNYLFKVIKPGGGGSTATWIFPELLGKEGNQRHSKRHSPSAQSKQCWAPQASPRAPPSIHGCIAEESPWGCHKECSCLAHQWLGRGRRQSLSPEEAMAWNSN